MHQCGLRDDPTWEAGRNLIRVLLRHFRNLPRSIADTGRPKLVEGDVGHTFAVRAQGGHDISRSVPGLHWRIRGWRAIGLLGPHCSRVSCSPLTQEPRPARPEVSEVGSITVDKAKIPNVGIPEEHIILPCRNRRVFANEVVPQKVHSAGIREIRCTRCCIPSVRRKEPIVGNERIVFNQEIAAIHYSNELNRRAELQVVWRVKCRTT